MLQQTVAIIIIAFFLIKLIAQKRRREIGNGEFRLWLAFWIIAALLIIFIKQVDYCVAYLGFSGSGINFLIYLAVLALFYLVFRMRLDMAKTDKYLTDIAREMTLRSKK